MEVLALTIDEVVKAGGPCRAKIYEEIRDGKLRAVKIGRSTRILVTDLIAYFDALPTLVSNSLPQQGAAQLGSPAASLNSNPASQLHRVVGKNKRHRRSRPQKIPQSLDAEKHLEPLFQAKERERGAAVADRSDPAVDSATKPQPKSGAEKPLRRPRRTPSQR